MADEPNRPKLPQGRGKDNSDNFDKVISFNQKVFGIIGKQQAQLNQTNKNFSKLVESMITAADLSDIADSLADQNIELDNDGLNAIAEAQQALLADSSISIDHLRNIHSVLVTSEKHLGILAGAVKEQAEEQGTVSGAPVSTMPDGTPIQGEGQPTSFTQGAGGIGMGIGAGVGLAGLGIGAAGAGIGFAISQLDDFDAEGLAEKVKVLQEMEVDGAAIFGNLAAIGFGLSAFAIGSAGVSMAQILDQMSQTFGGRPMAEAVKEDIETLLSIDLGGLGGMAGFLKGGVLATTMGLLGAGLAVFGVGSAVAGISEGINRLANAGSDGRRTSEGIKYDIETLLSTDVSATSAFSGLNLAAVMTVLAAGIAIFGAGSAVAGVSEGIQRLSTIGQDGKRVSDGIKYDIETLLSTDVSGAGDFQGLNLAATMTVLAAGLAAFGIGSAAAGFANFLDITTPGSSTAEYVKSEIETLLSIDTSNANEEQGRKVRNMLANIAGGLGAFGVADVIAGVGALIDSATTESNAERVVSEMENYLKIGELDEAKADKAAIITAKVAGALAVFGGADLITALTQGAAGLVRFFTGQESPIKVMQGFVEDAEDLDRVATSLDSALESLQSFGQLGNIRLNLEDFADDLKDSVPILEKAIMGDDKFFGTDIKGLASPEIDYEGAIDNLNRIKEAFGEVQNTANGTNPVIDAMLNLAEIKADKLTVGEILATTGTVGQMMINSQPVTTNVMNAPTSVNNQNFNSRVFMGVAPRAAITV